MIRAAIYLRVSSDKQAVEGDSIPAQRAALRKYIDDRPDMVLAGEYMDDGVSGTKSDRDELQRLLDDVRAGNVDRIVFTKLDRWFRSVRHYTATQEILDKYNVGWTAIWEPIYDTTTPQGRLIVNQMMSIAQFEAENTGQRVRQVFRHKVSQGEVISGSTPPGFTIKGKHLVTCDAAESVKTAFQEYSRTGNINQTMRICAGLPGLPRTKPPFKHMLTNPLYVGEYRGNPEYCEPIVDRAIFNDVQRQIRMNVKVSQRYTYIFSGLLRCAECGRVMAGNARKKNGKLWLQYRCPGHYTHKPGLCHNPKVMYETVLEKHMLKQFQSVDDLILKYEMEAKERKNKTKQKQKIEKKLTRLKDLYLDGMISLDEYKADREQLQTDLEAASQDEPQADFSALRALLKTNVEDLYTTLTQAEKRRLWRGIVDEIRFGADRRIEIIWRTK